MSEVSLNDDNVRLPILPRGWIWARFDDLTIDPKKDLVDGPFGSDLKASEYLPHGIPIIRLQNVDRNQFINKNIRFISPEKANELKRHNFSKNDIILTKLGIPLGKACFVPDYLEWGIIVADIVRLKINHNHLSKKFLVYAINSPIVSQKFAILTKGTTRPRVNLSKIRDMTLPIPPHSEQYRIVTKIEELLTQLDAGVASLKKVQAQLKCYRQAVLKAAFEGRLTQEWREEHKGEIEPADILIKSIGQDRDNFSKISTKKHIINHPEELPNLSEGWVWAIVNQILQPNRICSYGVLQPGNDLTEGIRLIRVGDINEGKIAIENLKRISPIISGQYPRTLLEGDEVLMTLVGAIGRTAVVPKSLAGANVARAVGVIPVSIRLNPKWVELWFRYPPKVADMTSKSHEVARKTLNLEDVRAAYVAIPPKEEQDKAVSEIERLFSIADEVEHTLETSLKQAKTLRQSILKRAFEGKLVPQNPNDEPASILLERIKAEKVRHVTEAKKGKTLQSKSPKRKIKNGN